MVEECRNKFPISETTQIHFTTYYLGVLFVQLGVTDSL